MRLLLDGRMLPATGVIGLADRPVAELADAYAGLLAQVWAVPAASIPREPVDGPLEDALRRLRPPAPGPATRHLLCPAGDTWTAFFDDARTGGDPFHQAAFLPAELGCRTLVVQAVPHAGAPPDDPALDLAAFALADPEHHGHADAVRAVTVTRYGATEATTRGTPLPGEPRDPAGLGLEALAAVAHGLGVDVFDAGAYFRDGATGLLLRQPAPVSGRR